MRYDCLPETKSKKSPTYLVLKDAHSQHRVVFMAKIYLQQRGQDMQPDPKEKPTHESVSDCLCPLKVHLLKPPHTHSVMAFGDGGFWGGFRWDENV